MSTLEVVVNSKLYCLNCADGEKESVVEALHDLNARINKAKTENVGYDNLSQEQLFLYQLILLSVEFNKLQQQYNQLKKLTKNVKNVASVSKDVEKANSIIGQLHQDMQTLQGILSTSASTKI